MLFSLLGFMSAEMFGFRAGCKMRNASPDNLAIIRNNFDVLKIDWNLFAGILVFYKINLRFTSSTFHGLSPSAFFKKAE